MEPLRTGLIGFGGRGTTVAQAMANASHIDFKAVCDIIQEQRTKAEREFNVETYEEVSELLNQSEIEAIVVITRPAGHAPLSIQALEAGKHVLCAKPIASNVEEARQMVATAQRTGRKGVVGFQNRFGPFFWTMKDVAEELDPIQVLLTNQRSMLLNRYLRPGYAYGVMDSVSHRIDLANWFIDRKPTAVSGTVCYETFTPEEAIDTANIQIEYTGGRTANLVASMGGNGLDDACQIIGENGNAQRANENEIQINDITFSEEFGTQKDRQQVNSRRRKLTSPPGETPATSMLEKFAKYVRGESEDPRVATFEDGLDALLVAKALEESHEKSQTVHLADLREETFSV